MALVASVDPGNLYAIPWGYGTNGLGYNVTKVKQILGDNVDLGNWDILFKPENAAKLKECGISMLDEAAQVFPAVLKYLGKDPNSANPDDYKAALDLLKQIRPYIRQFSSSGYIDELAVGDLCMVYGFSGDVMIARKRAQEAKKSYEVNYFIPKGGAPAWFDLMVIPKDAPHPEECPGVHQLHRDAPGPRGHHQHHVLPERQQRGAQVRGEGRGRQSHDLPVARGVQDPLCDQGPALERPTPANAHVGRAEVRKISDHER